jgi:hypothetical protein
MTTPIDGLTNPYTGAQPCSRLFAYGHTFRWVKGDRYVAVMKGICVDCRRVLIIEDHLAGQFVFETPQPVIDAIPAPHGDWADDRMLRRIADAWATRRIPERTDAHYGRM